MCRGKRTEQLSWEGKEARKVTRKVARAITLALFRLHGLLTIIMACVLRTAAGVDIAVITFCEIPSNCWSEIYCLGTREILNYCKGRKEKGGAEERRPRVSAKEILFLRFTLLFSV